MIDVKSIIDNTPFGKYSRVVAALFVHQLRYTYNPQGNSICFLDKNNNVKSIDLTFISNKQLKELREHGTIPSIYDELKQ